MEPGKLVEFKDGCGGGDVIFRAGETIEHSTVLYLTKQACLMILCQKYLCKERKNIPIPSGECKQNRGSLQACSPSQCFPCRLSSGLTRVYCSHHSKRRHSEKGPVLANRTMVLNNSLMLNSLAITA